jgi:aspartate/methionine/tyrosine aminotransferase
MVRQALLAADFRVDHSEAGLYLWVTRDEDCWDTLSWFAQHGVLVAPGSFYGGGGERHVRVALTVSDKHAEALGARLST